MADASLESIRAELRRRGYLQRGVERVLLQDALRPRATGAAVLRLALRVGLLIGLPGAVVASLGLALVNRSLGTNAGDVAALTAHLALPMVGSAALVFGLVALASLPLLRASRGRGERWALGLGLLASSLWLAWVALRGREIAGGSRSAELAVAAIAACVAWILGRVVYGGLLAISARFARPGAERPLLPRRLLGAVALLGAAVLLAPALLAVPETPQGAPFLPTAPGDRVLLIGVDGVLSDEFEYLLARGDLPAIARRRQVGSALLRYPRPSGPPASLWTSVATGLTPAAHGVVGVDSYRPAGVEVPLLRSGPWRAWWRLETELGLCEHRPVLAARRTGWTLWELAARGGAPVAAIDWWSTFPAEPLPGWVVAHGAFQLLAGNAVGAVEPASRRDELLRLRSSDAVAALDPQLRASLPGDAAEDVLARAVRPDLFYLETARIARLHSPRALALYLPGLDIAAAGWRGSDVAFGDLVRGLLTQVDRLVAESDEFATVAIVLDPGRRSGPEGRVLFLRRGCGGAEGTTSPEVVAASLMRALGLPQSAEIPVPADACEWPPAPSSVASYGARRAPGGAPAAGEEYLENLKALGYL